MSRTKTPIANDDEASAEAPKGTFWVQVVMIGLGVVPFEALNADCLSDVLLLLHRENPNDQYFDALSESRQQTRLYRIGLGAVAERIASQPRPVILRAGGPIRSLDS